MNAPPENSANHLRNRALRKIRMARDLATGNFSRNRTLRAIRRALNLTVGELSRETDGSVSVVALFELERGHRPVTQAEWDHLWPIFEWRMLVAVGLREPEGEASKS